MTFFFWFILISIIYPKHILKLLSLGKKERENQFSMNFVSNIDLIFISWIRKSFQITFYILFFSFVTRFNRWYTIKVFFFLFLRRVECECISVFEIECVCVCVGGKVIPFHFHVVCSMCYHDCRLPAHRIQFVSTWFPYYGDIIKQFPNFLAL